MRVSCGISTFEVLGTFVVVALILVGGMYLFSPQQHGHRASLSLASPIVAPIADQSNSIPLTIYNEGGQANSVVVTITSSALSYDSVSTQSLTVPNNGKADASVSPMFKDVPNGPYSFESTISYQDSNGSHTINGPTFTLYVLPNVQITGAGWEASGFLGMGQKDTIGPNDNTKLNFNVQSSSPSQIYTGLTASALISPQTGGLSASPATLSVQNLGPQGKSQQYSFTITSTNADPGKYDVTVTVFADGNPATSQTLVLTVSGS